MKRTVLMVACLIAAVTVFSQDNTKWDSTFRPNNWGLKWGQFKSYPNSSSDIIFFGNSITANVDWAELLARPNIRNRGISGDITFGLIERLEEVCEGKPAKLFVLIGINDISRNIPDTVILRNYARIIDHIQSHSPATKIYFNTLLPVNNEFTQFKNHYNEDEHIAFVNDGLKKLAAEKHITLIDLHPHFVDAAGKLDKRYTQDGLHLTAEGYQVWKALLEKGKYLDQ